MPSRVVVRALEAWPDVDFVNAYGLTETSSTIAVLGPEEHRTAVASGDAATRARLGSAGRVVPAVELEIRDEAGRPLPPGVTGRIWVRGPQVSGEYTGSGPALDERGFFDTRDEGFVDADGYLFIGGRTDDTIIRGAENIAPAEIEDVLLAHPMVSDAVVVGVPDAEWGQRLEAAVVARPGAEVHLDELKQFAKDRLRGSKTPVRIVLWDALPRTDTGKLIRRHALERLLAEQGSQAGKL
jgi:acyl-CoA synthetase (AMP-forming)/AMP-acid ligase II